MKSDFVIPSSPEDQRKISVAIEEMCNSLTRIDAEKDQLKSIVERLHEEFEMPKDLASRLAKTHHKRDFPVQEGKFETFHTVYAKFFPGESGS